MEEDKINEYNEIPVYYCKECLSLKIISLDQEQCFCDQCGGMDIDTCTIEDWENMFEQKYNHKFVNKNGRKQSYYKWATRFSE